MSHVTDIILVTSLWDGSKDFVNDPSPNVDLFVKESGIEIEEVSISRKRSKAIQCDMYIGAMDYYDMDRAIIALDKIKWESPECVQLMMKDEHEDIFTIYTPKLK